MGAKELSLISEGSMKGTYECKCLSERFHQNTTHLLLLVVLRPRPPAAGSSLDGVPLKKRKRCNVNKYLALSVCLKGS